LRLLLEWYSGVVLLLEEREPSRRKEEGRRASGKWLGGWRTRTTVDR